MFVMLDTNINIDIHLLIKVNYSWGEVKVNVRGSGAQLIYQLESDMVFKVIALNRDRF